VLSLLFFSFLSFSPSSRVHDDGDDETVEAEGFGENEDEDHSDVDVFLCVGTDTGVSHDADGDSSSEGGEATAHASSKVLVSLVGSVGWGAFHVRGLCDSTNVDDGDNEAVNSENTSHDTGNEGLEHELGSHDTDGADTDSRLGGSVGGTEVSENEGGGDSHESEESVLVDGSELFVCGSLCSSFGRGGHVNIFKG